VIFAFSNYTDESSRFSSDAIAAHGFAHELANYGEYSGAPTQNQTYEYAKTIRELLPHLPQLS
jgi:hypothetical protein